ncbi:MAG: hypothetical protein A3H49_03070 [Nitrospirae bacterium RIFCSPLOWO2_02_FULL_62_14]|nr:MAG: hypothetical protein A3H49_03070 [Nitrospirae bacterium RIFCSPLOWO2_02_FULL_62_14]
MQPDNPRTRIGILVIHGVGEQTQFEYLEAIAGNLFKALSQDPARKPQIQIRRGAQSQLHAPTESWRNVPAVVSWWSQETQRWIDAHFHEVTWADLDIPDTFLNWWRLVGWGLAMPGIKLVDSTRTFQARQQHVCLPVRLSVGRRLSVRIQLFGVSLLFFLMLTSINMFSWVLRRLSITFAPIEHARGIIYDYLGDVKLYQDWAIRDDGLEALGEKSRAAIQRRAVRALATMAGEVQHKRLDSYYVFSHSLGTVVAFNALMELGITLPNYFSEEEWAALPIAMKIQAGYDSPVLQKPRRPYWLGKRDAIDRSVLFAGLKGLLTMGSPLNKFAAMWPAIVPVNREALAHPVPWVNVADRQDIVAGNNISLFRSCNGTSTEEVAGLRLRNVPWADRLSIFTAHTSYWKADFMPPNPLGRVKGRLTGQHPQRLMNRLIPWLETGDGGRFEPPDDRMPGWLATCLYGAWLAFVGLALAFIPAFLLRWMETLWSGGDAAIHYSLWEAVIETITNPSSLAMHMGAVIGAGILTVSVCSLIRYTWEVNRDRWTNT